MRSLLPARLARIGALALLSSLVATSCVTMGKYRALKDRVDELEAILAQANGDISTLATRVDNLKGITGQEDSAIRERLAEQGSDLSELQMSMGALQGLQEELDFKMKTISKHVSGLKGLVEDRLGGDSEALPDALPEQPEAFFELGMSTMKSGLMKKARAIFKAFIAKFPSHDKADDAQFMIGETLFSEGRFTEAVTAFKTVYDQYQTGDRHKEAVLRIGLSYVRANNCKKALKIYEFAQKTFKGTPEAEAAAKEAKEIRAVCK